MFQKDKKQKGLRCYLSADSSFTKDKYRLLKYPRKNALSRIFNNSHAHGTSLLTPGLATSALPVRKVNVNIVWGGSKQNLAVDHEGKAVWLKKWKPMQRVKLTLTDGEDTLDVELKMAQHSYVLLNKQLQVSHFCYTHIVTISIVAQDSVRGRLGSHCEVRYLVRTSPEVHRMTKYVHIMEFDDIISVVYLTKNGAGRAQELRNVLLYDDSCVVTHVVEVYHGTHKNLKKQLDKCKDGPTKKALELQIADAADRAWSAAFSFWVKDPNHADGVIAEVTAAPSESSLNSQTAINQSCVGGSSRACAGPSHTNKHPRNAYSSSSLNSPHPADADSLSFSNSETAINHVCAGPSHTNRHPRHSAALSLWDALSLYSSNSETTINQSGVGGASHARHSRHFGSADSLSSRKFRYSAGADSLYSSNSRNLVAADFE